ncbi:regulatory protein RecX [Arthrobacter rhombi]|uniref:regulatory protein RecX n=1 Tax=Arthrobacter rhombi TaxID=71253 RepID=UPI003FD4EE31
MEEDNAVMASGDRGGGALFPPEDAEHLESGGEHQAGQEPGGRGDERRRRGTGRDPEADPESAARAIVLRQLTGSPKSRKQLADKLLERDIPDGIAENILDRFEELQLIDDAAFADAWVRSRARTRGLSRSALRRELRDKGIAEELSAAALEQLSGEDEVEMARELVEKKVRSMPAGLERDKGVRRLVAMLGRKGYSSGIAFRVVNEVWPDARG